MYDHTDDDDNTCEDGNRNKYKFFFKMGKFRRKDKHILLW